MNEAYNIDCMEYMRSVPDKFFDLAVVDPPYGDIPKGGYMNGTGGGLARQKKYHDAIWRQDRPEKEYFEELVRVSKNQIIWGANYFVPSISESSACWLVWDKLHPEGVNYADVEIAYTSFNRAARIFRYRWNGFVQENMANKENRIHPTQKPVALYRWIFNQFASPGDKIFDSHLGSGSSRIAAYDAGLDFVGCEIDKEYFEKQEERFAKHTSQFSLFLDHDLAVEQSRFPLP